MRSLILLAFCFLGTTIHAALTLVTNVDLQPLHAQVARITQSLAYLGAPLSAAEVKDLNAAPSLPEAKAIEKIQSILDRHALFGVNINPEIRVKVQQGDAKPELDEQGWRVFLVKVANDSGTTAKLAATSPNAQKLFNSPSNEVANRWLDMMTFDAQPLAPTLSGLPLEYGIIQLFSRDAGKREAKFSFNVGQGTQDIGFRNETDILFTARPAHEVTLRVRDENGEPTTASFVIRDQQNRIYPAQSKRLAPDLAFHPQIYRADGEKLKLPEGSYTFELSRGPESITKTVTESIGSRTRELSFRAERWIDPSKMGWWSGDHHIHAAGCAHYVNPTEGVFAQDMIRHCKGEDLKVGANLTWGPCFDFQKQFFCGGIDKVSQYPYLLRYDIEVSGFGSHQSGHLCLLRLQEQMYPGGDSSKHWPTLGLNTLKWAKKQGAVTGPAHSGWGLESRPTGRRPVSSKTSGEVVTASDELPNYVIPPFNGIGANEYIVDVTHNLPGPGGQLLPAVDFISTVDTPYVWELNIWYHTLNAGFRTRISGETDFPCIYGEKVGLGRSYVKLDGKLDYDQWCEGIRQGRNYVSDGKSHLMEFTVNGVKMGENGSELRLAKAGKVRVTADVAARLNEQPDPALQKKSYAEKPYWDIERARIGDSREVPVEVLVNGFPVAKKNIKADGKRSDVSFEVPIERSSWVAMRILPSSHSNPVFVIVDGKPIRERKSIEWCLKGVDQCWSQKERTYKRDEKEDALAAYDHARKTYQARLVEAGE